jgi:hypothetical protein
MFADKIWGIGFLGNCGVDMAREFHAQLEKLWELPRTKDKDQHARY